MSVTSAIWYLPCLPSLGSQVLGMQAGGQPACFGFFLPWGVSVVSRLPREGLRPHKGAASVKA